MSEKRIVFEYVPSSARQIPSGNILSNGMESCAERFWGLLFVRFIRQYLLFGFCLLHKAGIVIFRLVQTLFGADKHYGYHGFHDFFKRLTVTLVHCKQKEWQHDENHDKSRRTRSDRTLEHEKKRYTDECAAPEADNLPLCEVEKDFRFNR